MARWGNRQRPGSRCTDALDEGRQEEEEMEIEAKMKAENER